MVIAVVISDLHTFMQGNSVHTSLLSIEFILITLGKVTEDNIYQ